MKFETQTEFYFSRFINCFLKEVYKILRDSESRDISKKNKNKFKWRKIEDKMIIYVKNEKS